MADHVITLTDDEEAALADLVTRAQDDQLTVDLQLVAIAHKALSPLVTDFIRTQAAQASVLFPKADAITRTAILDLLVKKK